MTNSVLNMKETVARAKAEGINISLYALRKIVGKGLIPYRKIDRIILIPWDGFLDWALCRNFTEPKSEVAVNGIRRLS